MARQNEIDFSPHPQREEVGYLRINLDDITSNDKKWFVLHSTKKEQTLGAGLLYIDIKYGVSLFIISSNVLQ